MTEDASMAPPPDGRQFTEAHALQECPRCAARTNGAQECRVCRLVLDDATLETFAAERAKAKRMQSLALAAIMLALLCGGSGVAVGYALGRQATTTESQVAATTSNESATTIFRALPRVTRFQMHATQLQFLYAPNLLKPAAIRFTPVAIPQQVKARGTDDVTYVAASDAGWRQLGGDEQQVIVAALAQKHAAFLGFSGAADTAGFAAVLAAKTADGRERILAVRDRRGQIFIQP